SAYAVTFVLLLALLVFSAGHALHATVRVRSVRARDKWLAAVAGGLACCFPPSSQQLFFIWNRMPYTLLWPLAAGLGYGVSRQKGVLYLFGLVGAIGLL